MTENSNPKHVTPYVKQVAKWLSMGYGWPDEFALDVAERATSVPVEMIAGYRTIGPEDEQLLAAEIEVALHELQDYQQLGEERCRHVARALLRGGRTDA